MCSALLAAGSPALAQQAAVHVVGNGEAATRDQLAGFVSRAYTVAAHGAFASELRAAGYAGLPEAIGSGLAPDDLSALKAAGAKVSATIVVLGRIDPPGRTRQTMRIVIVDTGASTVLADERISIASARSVGKKRKKKTVWRADFTEAGAVIARALARDDGSSPSAGGTSWGELPDWASGGRKKTASELLAAPATAKKSTGADTDDDDDSRESSRASTRATPRVLSVKRHHEAGLIAAVGFNLAGRRYTYNDPLTSNLRPYSASGAPGGTATVHLYPAALAGVRGIAGDVGIEATYTQTIGLESEVDDRPGVIIGIDWRQWRIGPRLRVALGDDFLLGLTAGYGELAFTFDAPNDLDFADELPEVHYRILRAGFDFRWQRPDYSLLGGFAYDHLLASGLVGDTYFPKSKEAGIDAELGAAVHVAAGVEARLVCRYLHVFYDMRPEPGDAYVAGGALDQYLGLELGLSRAF